MLGSSAVFANRSASGTPALLLRASTTHHDPSDRSNVVRKTEILLNAAIHVLQICGDAVHAAMKEDEKDQEKAERMRAGLGKVQNVGKRHRFELAGIRRFF